MKATAKAPSNIAFIKYWGRKNEELRLPSNGSISMNLSGLTSTTTVEYEEGLEEDYIFINKTEVRENRDRIVAHLDRVRKMANINHKARVISDNTFPSSTGLSSSASGFAALTLAASKAAGLELNQKELSILARQGSGSACRSIPDGFVEWLDGDTSETSYSKSIFPPDYFDIADLVVILSEEKKKVATSDGQKLKDTSVFFKTRLSYMEDKIKQIKQYIEEKNFIKFGELVEEEALELHAIMFTSKPSLIYLYPNTIKLINDVVALRGTGLNVYFTINTGQNVHLICRKKDLNTLKTEIEKLDYVARTISSSPTLGASLI